MGGCPGKAIGGGALNAAKTHCPSGHEFDEKNTRWVKNKRARICRKCARIAYVKSYEKIKEQKAEIKKLEAKLSSLALQDR